MLKDRVPVALPEREAETDTEMLWLSVVEAELQREAEADWEREGVKELLTEEDLD